MGRADVYLQPEAADPVLSDALVLELVRRHVPGARSVAQVDESGGEARAYLVDDGIVLKVQRPHRRRPRTSLAKEAQLLRELGPALGDRIPRPLGYDQLDTDEGPVEYLCLSRVPGRAAGQLPLTPVARRRLVAELGPLLKRLHGARIDPSATPVDADISALRRRLEYGFGDIVDAFTDRTSAQLPMPLDELIGRVTDAVPTTLPHPPVVLHSNPGPTHVFVDPDSGRLTGLIDFGDSYASHPALDLHRWPDPADRLCLRDSYLDGEPADPSWHRMWTVAMIHTDLAMIAAGSPHARAAIDDLTIRLADIG